ncbi:MAG: L-threonine 3-dehydrogenase [Rhodospirillaceae bacterium]|nr:L-threonine 3-dehydrogenase [Rhodospirillaceae bacterium]|tara:strand:- start:223 stop:1254 length:1032 start_codon:yes stop_codon:yes gene_type:complete
MLAVCKVAECKGGIEVRNCDPIEPKAGEVRIKVSAAGICGTDMQIYNWAPRMARRMQLPRILGHEVCGIIEAVGPEVRSPKVGDFVSLESHVFCRECRQCRLGRAHLCEKTTYPGINFDGGFAEYVTVPSQICWVNPPGLSLEVAAMMEPFGISVHATREGSGVAGKSVLINGCGPIGLMNIATARAMGATKVIACDLNPIRLKTATEMGADRVVNAAVEDLCSVIADMTAHAGVDVAIEYTGSEDGFNTCFQSLSKGGDFRLVGAPPKPISVDFTQWLLKCPKMQNIHGRRIWDSWQFALELISAKKVDLGPIHSHSIPLSEGKKGFELILAGKAVKPLIIP